MIIKWKVLEIKNLIIKDLLNRLKKAQEILKKYYKKHKFKKLIVIDKLMKKLVKRYCIKINKLNCNLKKKLVIFFRNLEKFLT